MIYWLWSGVALTDPEIKSGNRFTTEYVVDDGPDELALVLPYVEKQFAAGFYKIEAIHENEVIFTFIKNSDIGTQAIWRARKK